MDNEPSPPHFEENKTPEQYFDSTLQTIATYLNVDSGQLEKNKEKLPIIPKISNETLARGYVHNIDTPEGPKCEWVVKNPKDTSACVHEFTHWLHYSSNPQLTNEYISGKEKNHKTSDLLMESRAIMKRMGGLETNVSQNIDNFLKRTGIEIPSLTELSNEEFFDFIKKRLDSVSVLQLKKLNRFFPSENANDALKRYTDTLLFSLKVNMPLTQEQNQSAGYEISGIEKAILDKIKEAIDNKNQSFSSIASIFEKADVPPNTSIAKDILIKTIIDKMTAQELASTIKKYYESGPITTVYEGTIATTFIGDELLKKVGFRYQDKEYVNNNLEEIREMLLANFDSKIAEKLEPSTYYLREFLKGLFDTQINKADAATQIAADSFLFFFDDLPDDPVLREKLMSNPDYVSSVVKMLTTSNYSPLLATLGTSFEAFTSGSNEADKFSAIKSSRVLHKPSDIDVASFVATESNLLNKTDFNTLSPSNDLKNTEFNYWNSIFKLGLQTGLEHPDWDEKRIDEEIQKTIVSKAAEICLNSLTEKTSQTQLLLEPIAHVITNLITNEPIDYGASLMGFGGYQTLLSSQDVSNPDSAINEWHEKIKKIIVKVKKEKNLKRLVDFFQAKSLEEQKKILDSYK